MRPPQFHADLEPALLRDALVRRAAARARM
jgi:hypothetical protein